MKKKGWIITSKFLKILSKKGFRFSSRNEALKRPGLTTLIKLKKPLPNVSISVSTPFNCATSTLDGTHPHGCVRVCAIRGRIAHAHNAGEPAVKFLTTISLDRWKKSLQEMYSSELRFEEDIFAKRKRVLFLFVVLNDSHLHRSSIVGKLLHLPEISGLEHRGDPPKLIGENNSRKSDKRIGEREERRHAFLVCLNRVKQFNRMNCIPFLWRIICIDET
ncbi:hypothetical protein MIMGU_mgv11b017943mg [Erythranthe guttata]|uniref:Uncharacterized protein n=1 Tax=Erythranthe guttata TaxID=4155 RepID=A0A022QSD7_ERYGU|nr:hypothetical protein MIMGU_mgv11b017943mg [Erythranthe guttata]